MYDFHSTRGLTRLQITSANLPMKTIGKEFSDLDSSPALVGAKKWVESVREGKVIQALGENTCGLGLLLTGDPGHGKTTLASVILQELIRTMPRVSWGDPDAAIRRPVYFSDYPRILRLQKNQWSDEKSEENQLLLDSMHGEAGREYNIRVLVIDDLGKEYRTSTGWAENTFDALLRSRFNAGLPTIITSNVSLLNWNTVYSEAMASFAHESFIPFEVKSEKGDRRK